MNTTPASYSRSSGPKVHSESQLEPGDRFQIRPGRTGYDFRKGGVIDSDELTRLSEAAVANGRFHVPGEKPRYLVNRVYRRHVGPIGDAIPRVRPLRPWHRTSVDERAAAGA
jgi:hypothetical protein